MSESGPLVENAHIVQVDVTTGGVVHACLVCGYCGPSAPPLPCPGDPALVAARAVAEAAVPGLSGFPKDCRNTCYDDACTCSGVRPVLAWSLDMDALRSALGMSNRPGQPSPTASSEVGS